MSGETWFIVHALAQALLEVNMIHARSVLNAGARKSEKISPQQSPKGTLLTANFSRDDVVCNYKGPKVYDHRSQFDGSQMLACLS